MCKQDVGIVAIKRAIAQHDGKAEEIVVMEVVTSLMDEFNLITKEDELSLTEKVRTKRLNVTK